VQSIMQPSKEDVLRKFFALGYFQGQEWDKVRHFVLGSKQVVDAIERYRDKHELPAGNVIDDTLVTSLMMPRCGVPDFAMSAGVCKWPMLKVTAAHRIEGLNPLASEIEKAVWLEALAAWNAVCGLSLTYTDDMASANIYANVGSTDPGVLAYSYLPCGATPSTRLAQVYNRATNWSRNLLLNVAIHELGHAIGLDHGPRGCIMQPTANGSITSPQEWDIAEVVSRYGKPKEPPLSPPVPQPPLPPNGPRIVLGSNMKAGEYVLVPASPDWDMTP
jgi:hypothetical protein